MTSLLHSLTNRAARVTSSTQLWRMATVFGALGLSLASCKASEAPRAPEAAAPAQAAPAPVQVSTAPTENGAAGAPASGGAAPASAPSIHGFTMKRLDGTETSLSAWAGKVLLVVNTASKCGYTPQYQGLQQLHAKYAERGFAVLGFPSNDFGGQEPGSSQEIAKFCISMYDVNFPMFEKIKVIGQERSPLYALLSDARGAPKWNFHKYLIDKHGQPVAAWPSPIEPGSPEIAAAIEAQLAAK
jgi:glutathione peroxidase